jgi:hypothetical protein
MDDHQEPQYLAARNLSHGVQQINFYAQCHVNGVKFLSEERDKARTTQNSGVMLPAENGVMYYGVLLHVVELIYNGRMPVVLFKCRWYELSTVTEDNGLISVNTNTNSYRDDAYCLAIMAKQVIKYEIMFISYICSKLTSIFIYLPNRYSTSMIRNGVERGRS